MQKKQEKCSEWDLNLGQRTQKVTVLSLSPSLLRGLNDRTFPIIQLLFFLLGTHFMLYWVSVRSCVLNKTQQGDIQQVKRSWNARWDFGRKDQISTAQISYGS